MGLSLAETAFFFFFSTPPILSRSVCLSSASLCILLTLPPHVLFLSMAEFRACEREAEGRREFWAPDWLQIIF